MVVVEVVIVIVAIVAVDALLKTQNSAKTTEDLIYQPNSSFTSLYYTETNDGSASGLRFGLRGDPRVGWNDAY